MWNRAHIASVVSQALAAAMWASDYFGHPAVGSVLHDPSTAATVTAVIAGGFQLVAIIERAYVAYKKEGA